nr:TIM44-like domain-containing protein [Acetobacter garciniae]
MLGASLATGPLAVQADARAGQGSSMGSRGSRTWSAPPATRTSPYSTAPMDRSITPRTAPTGPGFGGSPQMAAPFARPMMPYQNRHPFLTGFAGGFLGAGLFGLLSGHGFMGGVHGLFSLVGLLIQVGLVVMLVMWLVRRFSGAGPARAGFNPGTAGGPMGAAPTTPRPTGNPIQITTADYQLFQQTLLDIQNAWNQQNISAMQRLATPEMVSYFNEQLAALASQGARNVVSDVRFLQGDLAEAWAENGMDYATVAMRYSLIDLTTNAMGQVIDGSSTEPVTITELWTFTRPSRGGRWLLSAIQQAR